ncbi:NVEALA domain-containing protein [Albibacterium indicum]|uniref:NVEALA domain-containing protein n=1 Tax=Albibacterium indicum TaxID=2292082 RepID=UPI000E511780|nr:NVEALA domain-containing protein [Pedobacter indicus]
MKKKILGAVAATAFAAVMALNLNVGIGANETSALTMNNIEALANGEGADCPNGCKDVGWGTQEILKCDCTYTSYFSSCDSWGC